MADKEFEKKLLSKEGRVVLAMQMTRHIHENRLVNALVRQKFPPRELSDEFLDEYRRQRQQEEMMNNGIYCYPSELYLAPIPFVDTLGSAETELSAAIIVFALQKTTNTWRSLPSKELGEVMQKYGHEGWLYNLMRNPFCKPDWVRAARDGWLVGDDLDKHVFTLRPEAVAKIAAKWLFHPRFSFEEVRLLIKNLSTAHEGFEMSPEETSMRDKLTGMLSYLKPGEKEKTDAQT
jgi:hypothetical protein